MLKWVFGGGLPCEAEHWGEIGRMPIRVKGPGYAETQSMSGSDLEHCLIDNSSEFSPSRLKATEKNLFL